MAQLGRSVEAGAEKLAGTRQMVICGVTYCLLSLIFGLQLSIIGPTASLLANQTGVTEADLAPVMGMSGLGMVVGGLPAGWMMDRVPGHVVLGVSHLIQAIGFFLMPLCPSVFMLAVVFGTISLTFVVVNTALNCMAIWIMAPEPGKPPPPMTVAFLLNTISALFGVGALAAPQIVHFMAAYSGSGINVFYVAVGTSLAAVVAVALLGPSPTARPAELEGTAVLVRHTSFHRQGSSMQRVMSWQGSHLTSDLGSPTKQQARQRSAGGVFESPQANGSLSGEQPGTPSLLPWGPQQRSSMPGSAEDGMLLAAPHSGLSDEAQRSKWRLPFLVAALAVMFANISIELGFGNWIYTYCVRHADLSETAAQEITSLFWLAFTLGRVPAMVMVQYVSVATIMAVTMPLAVIGSLLPLILHIASPGAQPSAPGSTLGALAAQLPAAAGAGSSSWGLIPSAAAMGGFDALGPVTEVKETPEWLVIVCTLLVALGSAAGMPCTLSFATEYVTVDGFLNGVIGTVAGVGATTFPYVVPVLAKAIPAMGFQCLMAATLVMALLQLASLVAMLAFGRAMGKLPAAKRQDIDWSDDDLEEPLLQHA